MLDVMMGFMHASDLACRIGMLQIMIRMLCKHTWAWAQHIVAVLSLKMQTQVIVTT